LPAPAAAFSFGAAASLSLPAESTARFDMRPRLTPNRLMPLPTPLAVSTGSVTTFTVLLPTFRTAPPADLRKTSLFETSSSEARAPISLSRVVSWESPMADSSP
jgi:hypothetical protein